MRSNRRFSRFLPEQPEIWITTATGIKVVGELVNESYGGIGVTVEDPAGLANGDEVNVQFDETPEDSPEEGKEDWVQPIFPAQIVAYRKQEENFFLGLKWTEEGEDEENEASDEPLPWEIEPETQWQKEDGADHRD